MDPLKGHDYVVTSVAVSSNERNIVSGSMDSTIRIWDALSGHGIIVLRGSDPIETVVFSPD
jgi:WD40 repeat protein